MGMYTELTARVKLKPEFIPVINKMLDQRLDKTNDDNQWSGLGYEFLDNFVEIPRSSWIPFGDQNYEDFVRGLSEDGVWEFSANLKNYDFTIEYFLDNVLAKMIEESYLIEYLYEEWDTPDLYQFIDGEMELIKEHAENYWN